MARIRYKRNGENGEKIVPYHPCSAEELNDFPPPIPDSVGLMEIYKKENPKRHLFCLDWDKLGEELAIWGTENDEISYQRFEYILLPCNYVHAEFGPVGDTIPDECIADRDK